MHNKVFSFILFLFLPILAFSQGHTTSSTNLPRLVIGLVIEDFNPDYIDRYWDKFGEGGFQRLYRSGYVCTNHHYDHLIQRPSVNMATLSTGSNPSRHGIVNDSWIDRLKNKEVNAIRDEFYTTVGADSDEGDRSAMKLMTPTLGDQLKLVTNGRSKVFSVAMNDISAVLAAGHAANGAYWMDNLSGKMISSSYYTETFPKWAFDFNGFKMADMYIGADWTLLKDINYYSESVDLPKENGYPGRQRTFPYDLGKLKKEAGGSYKILKTTPWGNTLVKDFALQMIPKEQLGADLSPDILTLVFSSMDYHRYSFGSFSVEMEDTYLRLDRDIAELLKYLETGFGTNEILIYLTGLNSMSYSANLLKEKYHMTAGIFNPESAIALLKSYLNIKYGEANWIELFANQMLYLDHELIDKKKVDLHDMQESVASFLNQFEGIASAKSSMAVDANNFVTVEAAPFQNSFHIKRSGDVLIKYEAGWQPKDKYNPLDYTDNNQVPLVWYGGGIKKGTLTRRTNATDVVPTIAAFLGITPSSSVSGKAIEEVIKH